MKSLFELYKPRAKKEKEWWDANKVEKKPLAPGEKTDFEGQPVKTYDRKDMGAKAGKDTAGEVCEDEQLDELSKKTLASYLPSAGVSREKNLKIRDKLFMKNAKNSELSQKEADKYFNAERKTHNRGKGIRDASRRLTKEELNEKKENHNYPSTTDDEEDHDFRPHWIKRRKRQETA